MSATEQMTPKSGQGNFMRSAGVLAGGTALSQVVALAATPLLTRMFVPADFGLLAVFVSLVSIVLVPASLRYEQAIPVPKENRDAAQLVLLGLLLVSLTTAVLAMVLAIGDENLFSLIDNTQLYSLRWLLLPALFGAGIYQVLNCYAIRVGAFGIIARTRVSKNVSMLVTQLGLGAAGVGGVSLIFGEIVNRMMGMGVLARLTWVQVRADVGETTKSDLINIAKRYWRFPALSAPSALVNVAGFQLPVILLANWFGGAVVGWFALSLRVLQAPVALVGQAVGQVFFSQAGEHHRSGNLPDQVNDVTTLLICVGIGPALFVAVSGGDVFAWVFGAEWGMAGQYSQWLIPWLFLTFVTSPRRPLYS